jgi:lysophospholipase L1-like esterase
MLARTAWPIVLSFALANVLLWLAVKSSGLERTPVDVQTSLIYRARLDGFFAAPARGPRAVLLGDSLVFGANLQKQLGERWQWSTLPAQFERVMRAHDPASRALNLGVNGILFSDLVCVVRDVLARAPELLVIGVSPRPFSSEFATAGAESARPFLCPAAASGTLARLNQSASSLAYALLPAYRYRDLWQFRAFDSTPRKRLVSTVLSATAAIGEPPADPEDAEEQAELTAMMQSVRAAQRYNSLEVRPSHPQARALRQLLAELSAQRSTRVLVFYLHENLAPIEAQLDVPHYQDSARRFSELVSQGLAGAPRARFTTLDARGFSGEYTDHIHLTARGYARLAERLAAELPP